MMNRCVPAVVVFCSLSSAAAAQDAIYIAGSSGGQTKITGRVVDYNGRELTFEHLGGKQQSFDARRVLRVETRYVREHTDADALAARGRADQALAFYRRAREVEQRAWVRRKIAAEIVRCYHALGRVDLAGEEFLALVGADPQTPYFDCIPLAWLPRQAPPGVEQAALRWVVRQEPAAQLLGASYLLSGRRRLDALRLLRQLGTSSDRRLALLAVAQTWRADAVTADQSRLDSWTRTVEQMPEPLRAGPYYVLGLARLHHGQAEQAALALMRVPILYPQQRELAARALLDAGGALEKLNQANRAGRLYRELLQKYPETTAVAEARSRMEKEGRMMNDE